ncbi:hypothetical protein ACFQZS_17495 [Mucilaginibacter calamicampi]|uniref:Uncharacterized protein n=1 Tax=Mucilaginibacter calamicampi TaxID=1302352 RepID=A0ABW2YZZ5_9SPHI
MKDTSLLKKAITSVMVGFIVAAALLVLGHSGAIPWFPPPVVFSLVGLTLLVSIVFPFVWQYKENRQRWNSTRIYVWFYNVIRYGIAFNLSTFAFKKFFGLQLTAAKDISNTPLNMQSGETLTWYYFSYSHTFAFILALLQLGGAILLLFRRTLLLGSVILFSLMLNITLIDIFYHLNLGALFQALIVTAGVLFILLLHYERLLAFFIKPQPDSFSPTEGSVKTKNLIRLSMMAFALLYTYYLTFI